MLRYIATDRLTEDADFDNKKIIFSDEAHFYLGGYVNTYVHILIFQFDNGNKYTQVVINKQSCRICATENPHKYIENPTQPKRVTVWCAFWSRGIIGPYFFVNVQAEAVAVNGDHYGAMLIEFLFTQIEEEDIRNIRFQQDGATCHTAEATLDVWRPVFEDRIISRTAVVIWPHRVGELTSLDYYLRGVVKDMCYADKLETTDGLKNNIREAIGEIQMHLIDDVLKNWINRVGYCMASRGSHSNEIIFH